VPKSTSVINDFYDVEDGSDLSTAYLREDELGNVKTIFWAFNIVDFTPMTQAKVTVNGDEATIVGSWFNHHLSLPTGEELDAGVASMRLSATDIPVLVCAASKTQKGLRIVLGARPARAIVVARGESADLLAKKNRRLLYHAMKKAGFTNYPSEWWHYDYGDTFWGALTGLPVKYPSVYTEDEILELNNHGGAVKI
jgi:hypothetical protein